MSAGRHRYVLDVDSLRYAARKAGFTGWHRVRDLSVASGVEYRTLKTYFQGATKQPCASFVMQLADALGVEPWDLMKEEE